jgi:hypothetical protein
MSSTETVLHHLKIWPKHFDDIANGRRTAELRIDDRHYKAGDFATLEVFDPITGKYDGRGVTVEITHVLSFRDLDPTLRSRLGLNPSFGSINDLVILSIRKIDNA